VRRLAQLVRRGAGKVDSLREPFHGRRPRSVRVH